MFTRLIKKIQEQPVGVRKNVAFVVAFILTAPIALVWVGTLSLNTSSQAAVAESVSESPFALVKDLVEELGSIISDTKGQVGGLFDGEESNEKDVDKETTTEVSEKEVEEEGNEDDEKIGEYIQY